MEPAFTAFLDELEKIAAVKGVTFSRARLRQFAARLKGRHRSIVRPRKATTVIRQNTLKHKLGEYNPTMGNASAPQPWMIHEISPKNPNKKKGDVPSREEMDEPKRMDARESAATVFGPGSQLNNIAATNYPTERT